MTTFVAMPRVAAAGLQKSLVNPDVEENQSRKWKNSQQNGSSDIHVIFDVGRIIPQVCDVNGVSGGVVGTGAVVFMDHGPVCDYFGLHKLGNVDNDRDEEYGDSVHCHSFHY